MQQAVIQLETSQKTDSQKQDANVPIPDILVASRSSAIHLITSSDRSSPDGQERETPPKNSQLDLENTEKEYEKSKLLENNK